MALLDGKRSELHVRRRSAPKTDSRSRPSDRRDEHGFTPLHWASRQGRETIAEMLIARGARVDIVNMGGDSALHLASAHGYLNIAKIVSVREGKGGPARFFLLFYKGTPPPFVLSALVDSEQGEREGIERTRQFAASLCVFLELRRSGGSWTTIIVDAN